MSSVSMQCPVRSDGKIAGRVAASVPPFAYVEELLLAAVLAAMMFLPLAEAFLRVAGWRGISGSTTIVQHCTLVLSMAGAAMAARRGRLLCVGAGSLLPARMRAAAAWLSSAGSATVAALLCLASTRFVLAERESSRVLAWRVPVWIVECALPLGFALIALRVITGASRSWAARSSAAGAAVALAACVTAVDLPPRVCAVAGTGGLLLMAIAGAPMFAILGGAALVAYVATAIPLASLTISQYALVVNPSLPAIPLFTLAGYILAEGSASRRLVRLFDAAVGGMRGGPAIVTVLSCAFFTTFTGGSGVTILAVGGLLLPILMQARYRERDALGLVTGAGALGILFPPCLPLILYAVAANVDVRQLFLAGMVPGVLLLAATVWLGWLQQPAEPRRRPVPPRQLAAAFWDAKWEVLLPIVVLSLLFGGIATPVEAAAATALYALVVELALHRESRGLWRILQTATDSALLVGGVLLILGIALGLTGFLIDAEIPQRAVAWATANVHSTLAFLLLLNLFLIVVGALMDIYSAIIVVVPLIVPLGMAFGVDPIHLGIIFLTNLELGYLVPPVGENLFIAAYRFDKPIAELARAVLPMVGVLLVVVLAVTYLPSLSLWLVRIGGG